MDAMHPSLCTQKDYDETSLRRSDRSGAPSRPQRPVDSTACGVGVNGVEPESGGSFYSLVAAAHHYANPATVGEKRLKVTQKGRNACGATRKSVADSCNSFVEL